MNDNNDDNKKKYKEIQRVLNKQHKAQKVYAKNTNKVAKEILKNNEKNNKSDGNA